ncbi:MAG: RNA polymerase sigma factor [Lachnospiraceae bacterium]
MTYTEAIEKALAGDESGFQFLYDSTKKEKYYLALKYVKDKETAEDVLQESYLKAWEKLDTVNPEKFEAWFAQIVANTAKNVLEKRKHTALDLREDADEELEPNEVFDRSVSSWENQPELSYTQKETAELVHQMLDELPDEQRFVVLMFEIEGLTTKEIAESLGCAEATVKSRLKYGRNKIKAKAEELQKKGYKLYSIPPMVLLMLLLQKEQKVFAAEVSTEAALNQCREQVLKNTDYIKSATAYTSGATAVKTTFFATKAGKILIGIVAATVVGGTAAGVLISNSNKGSASEVIAEKDVEAVAVGENTAEQSNAEESGTADDKDPYFNYEERFDLGDPESYGTSGYYNSVDLEHIEKLTGEKIERVNEDMEVNSSTGYIMLNMVLYKESFARKAEFPSPSNEYTLSPKNYYEIPNGTIAHVNSCITIPAKYFWGVGTEEYTVTVYEATIDGDTGFVLQNAFNGSPADVNPVSE